ncbi:translation initiation factor IF-2 N-terminal domain-containing protein [Gordonia sp. OPL2]|uniref:translation initiation factor IF-2 N-terminal domain-containing protein n=1 Tax=Gordonia sp. OPL2 TaxID=2486274 RepID=UPI0016563FA2|nr:translation initiation factor IF-2 N-terminal domain-containing protein [Gordonia sp. OPL2]RPA12612.1 Rne/Rng family ribonuclease [Gordonia sp. OPL2]
MTDNGSPTDANAASEPAEEFPSRLRVHALARTLGLTSRQVLAHLAELGVATRSPQSSIDRETAQAVADRVRSHVEVDEAALEATDDAADRAGTQEAAAEEPAVTSAPEAASAEEPAAPAEPATEEPATQEPATVETTSAEPAAAGAVAAQSPVSDESSAVVDEPADEPAADTTADITADSPVPPAASTDDAEATETTEATGDAPRERPADREPPTLFSAADDHQHYPIPSAAEPVAAQPLFLSPQSVEAPKRPARAKADTDQGDAGTTGGSRSGGGDSTRTESTRAGAGQTDADTESSGTESSDDDANGDGDRSSRRRRRGRRGRGRGRGDQAENGDDSSTGSDDGDEADSDDDKSTRPSGKKTKKSKGKDRDKDDDRDSTEDADAAEDSGDGDSSDDADDQSGDDGDQSSSKRRRRRRRRKGGSDADDSSPDDPPNTVVHEREPRSKRARDEVQGISGSTRLEAKRQRRRDGRDAGRRRPPILSESEFLARREAVDRVMVVRERSANSAITVDSNSSNGHEHAVPVEDYTQVAVLEDGVLVEHFVTTETSSSMVGNIYLGRVQNVLPGMEAAFVDIGRGRNGVLYAGEVNWDAAGLDGGSRKIEQALKPGDNVLVQVSKDPVGHKGARLTTQISLAGRYLVYVPGGSSTGISRKLPDVERKRLKSILGKLVPDDAGVIIRTASEGVSADDLGADIARLEGQWKEIDAAVAKAKKGSGSTGPAALYEEPDLLVRVVRDLFNEDFKKLVVEGQKAWDLVERYVGAVAPDLMERVERFEKANADAPDSFVVHRIDEQLAKALDRKVWLPSGGTLIIEHTEAMTVVDVNTGKFTGSGGNLEETVTRNNLEAAEEIVRQMRLRDIGGMIIVDFIDMVLESNRDLVLRRLTEALARDRTRHQVSEVTSLGLVQMTRKRLGTGLLEAFSTTCTHCGGRGIIVHANPVEVRGDDSGQNDGGSKRSRRNRKKNDTPTEPQKPTHKPAEHPMFRAMAAHAHDDDLNHGDDQGNGNDQGRANDQGNGARHADDAPAGVEVAAAPDGSATDGTAQGANPSDEGTTQVDDTSSDDSASDSATRGATRREPRRRASRQARAARAEQESTTAPDEPSVAPAPETSTADGGAKAADVESEQPTPTERDSSSVEADTTPIGTAPADVAASADTGSAPAPRRRRRVVRQAAAPPVTAEPVVMTTTADPAPTEPVTTSGPVAGDGASETTIAVRRRPRRRTAGRPAGPPPAEQ